MDKNKKNGSESNKRLKNIKYPNLFRNQFSYENIPEYKDENDKPIDISHEIWITDTTFRDGQQSREPYSVEEIVNLFDLLNKLGGPKGLIKQTEFFLYTETDKKSIEKCLEKGYEFPEITGWIRATDNDFKLVKDMGLKETGILVSCSDYHIFNKLNMNRKEAFNHYINIIKKAIDYGIKPRCHFEDITRADFDGFVIPFAYELNKISESSNIPIKIRACDTLGLGVSYEKFSLPRSVPKIIHRLKNDAGFSSENLEWHGHNDFYRGVSNSVAAWLSGASAVNCSLLGIGERTGNTPLEAMVVEYAQIMGTTNGMDTKKISEMAQYYQNHLGYYIPPNKPFVGKNFNTTQAGIHADGLLKNEEIYNIFNTEKIFNKKPGVVINSRSGLSGITYWLNQNLNLEKKIDKKDKIVFDIKQWIDEQYKGGRVTPVSDVEMKSYLLKNTNLIYEPK